MNTKIQEIEERLLVHAQNAVLGSPEEWLPETHEWLGQSLLIVQMDLKDWSGVMISLTLAGEKQSKWVGFPIDAGKGWLQTTIDTLCVRCAASLKATGAIEVRKGLRPVSFF